MKFLVFLLTCACAAQVLLSTDISSEKWDQFKKFRHRKFVSEKEETLRRAIFMKNLQEVEEHNEKYAKGIETYTIDINDLSDLTDEEVLLYTHGIQVPSQSSNVSSPSIVVPRGPVPESLDWRKTGMITPVKNQGSCGSCWAFSVVGALEAHYKIRYRSTAILSEQQLVDCDKANRGCKGGWMGSAFAYIRKNGGINLQRDYPYRAAGGTCRYSSAKPRVSVRRHIELSKLDENTLKRLVATNGPVSVAVDAGGRFASYKSGIYYNASCSSNRLTHAVVIVGYGRENGQDYWLVKNSWGTSWGQAGYIKIARNRNNHCGIASAVVYPVL